MARLIDADKLKNHYSWWEGGTAEYDLNGMKKLFDDIIDAQPTAEPEWICADDDPPAYGEPVIAVMEVYVPLMGKKIVGRTIGVCTCEYDGEAERERWYFGDKEVEVTHWMPQPAFPDEWR